MEAKKVEALFNGSHSPNSKMCIMEAAAYVAGAPWSDSPKCVSPKIAEFLRNWNDSLPDNESRTRLLTPLIPEILGTAGSEESEMKRSWMAFDWLARECGPAFMDLTESLKPQAKALRELPPIYDKASLDASRAVIDLTQKASAAARAAAWDAAWDAARTAARDAARAAAWDAARDAAWAAAWAAARDAARAAARDAARTAARDAARAAAWDAAWDAARVAAGDAARNAARDAARNALASTVLALQESAQDLVRRMASIERIPFEIKRRLIVGEIEIR